MIGIIQSFFILQYSSLLVKTFAFLKLVHPKAYCKLLLDLIQTPFQLMFTNQKPAYHSKQIR